MKHRLQAEPLAGIGEIKPGDDLAQLIAHAIEESATPVHSGEVVVVAQKLVSKSEGRLRRLSEIQPGDRATQLSRQSGKDPRLVQAILDESEDLIRAEGEVLIARTHQGLVCANAGVDQSNVPADDVICLLPVDSDRSARDLRSSLAERLGHRPAIVISDSFGRPWRLGQSDVAVGCAGLLPIEDLHGEVDAHGRELAATVSAIADQAAGTAALVRDKKGNDGVVVIRGLERYTTNDDGPGAASIQRSTAQDLFG